MNKMYEAPQSEVIEMQTVSVLMVSGDTTGGGGGTNVGGGVFPWS